MHSSELHTICTSYCQIKLQDAPLYEDIDAIENTGDNGDFIFHTDNDDDCVDNLIIHANNDDDWDERWWKEDLVRRAKQVQVRR